ncbi:MAG: alpha/beta hydrolase [Solirubrobacteraceae bacterium]
MLLHGTGGDEHDLVPLGRRLAPGATLLSPRGKVLEAGMPRFFRRLAVGQLDIPDLLTRTDELAAFVAAATDAYQLDAERAVAVGLSNGANIASSLLLRSVTLTHHVLRGATLLLPMLPYEPEHRPELSGIDVLIAAGEHDPFSPPQSVRRLAEILSAAGARVTATTEPGASHNLNENDLQRLTAWVHDLTA